MNKVEPSTVFPEGRGATSFWNKKQFLIKFKTGLKIQQRDIKMERKCTILAKIPLN